MLMDRPVRFAGTEAERSANFKTHAFSPESDRCMNCDCKRWHAAADYPCGTEPPRETVEINPRRISL